MSEDRLDARTDAPRTRTSLFWRLMPSYLLVIVVGTATSLIAGDRFAPVFLERHVNSMVRTMHNLSAAAMDENMIVELSAGYRRALAGALTWAAVVSAVVAALVGLFVTHRIVTPLRALTQASRRVAGGMYHSRLDPRVPGEIGDLVDAFNTMASTLERSEGQRVALLADVSHEFRTPMSNLRGYVEGLEDGVFDADATTLGACRRQLERLERLVGDISLLSRVESGQLALHPTQVDLTDLLEQTHDAFYARFARKDVHLVVDAPAPPLPVFVDPERTAQALANLVGNALRHTPAGGRVTLRAYRLDATRVQVDVEDTGDGIDERDVPHLFTRFFRGDKSRAHSEGGGSGIGLTLVKQFVERQGGVVGVESRTPGGGARFWLTLPVVERTNQD